MHAVTGTGRLIAGRYRLQGPVGRGAMGIVWRGRDELLHRDVAVKQVQITALTLPSEAELAYQRTLREARTAARLSHPAVVTVFDVVEEDGSPWIIMEFIGGRSLEQVIAEDGPLPPLHAAELGTRLLGALETAHAAGVLHRDVKPSNVLIAADGRAVLTDFGIATFAEDPGITQAGMVVGTPGFTAPERVRGGSATPASDLWSLGATLYAAVEGRGPFERPGGSMAIIAGVAGEEAPRAPSAGPLAPVIDALLDRDPARRPDAGSTASLLAAAAATGTATRPVPADQGYNSLGYDSLGRDSQGRDSMSYSQHILGTGRRALRRYLTPADDLAGDGRLGDGSTGGPSGSVWDGAGRFPGLAADGLAAPSSPPWSTAGRPSSANPAHAPGLTPGDATPGPGVTAPGSTGPDGLVPGRSPAPSPGRAAPAEADLKLSGRGPRHADPSHADPGQTEPGLSAGAQLATAQPATAEPGQAFLDPPDFARLHMPGPGDDLADGLGTLAASPAIAPGTEGTTGYQDDTAGLPEFMDSPGDPAHADGPEGPAGPPGTATGPAGTQPAPSRRGFWGRHWRIVTAGGAIATIVVAAAIGLGVYSGLLAASAPAPDSQAGPGPRVTERVSDTPRAGTSSRPAVSNGGAPGGAGQGSGTSPSHSPQPSQSTSVHPSSSPTKPSSGHGSKTPSPGSSLGPAPAGYEWHSVKAAALGTTAGFAIAAPDGWEMQISAKTAYFYQPGGHGRVSVSLHKWVYTAPMREARALQQAARSNDPGYRFGSVRPTDFMSVAAAVSRFSWQPVGRAHRTQVLSELFTLATTAGVQPYQVSVSAGVPYAAADRQIYQQMLATFQPLT
jgi:serine/threonine protein kinase